MLREALDQVWARNPFNSIGLNRYRDPHDSAALRNVRLADLVPGQPIALLSLGATRWMAIRRKVTPRLLKIDLEAGSLSTMSRDTQLHCDHAIPKRREQAGMRISMAFRGPHQYPIFHIFMNAIRLMIGYQSVCDYHSNDAQRNAFTALGHDLSIFNDSIDRSGNRPDIQQDLRTIVHAGLHVAGVSPHQNAIEGLSERRRPGPGRLFRLEALGDRLAAAAKALHDVDGVWHRQLHS